MDSQNNFISPKLIVLFLFTTLTSQTLSIDPKYMSCAPRTCGQGPNISYPFWFSDDQHSFCGHPNFEITCSRNNPVLTISNDDYVIKDISYGNHFLLVANAAAAAVYQETCPNPAHNFSLHRSPFNISPGYTNFSLLYNCSQKPDEIYSTYPISCATNDTQYSFAAFHIEALEYYNYSFGSCQSIVKAPLHAGDGDFESLLSMNYTEVLRLGFVLNWTANNCSTCERSGGRCGFENNELICFCRDRPRLKSCPNGESLNVGRKVAIGVATCIGTVAIMIIVFYFWLRRNKNKYAPSSFVSRSIASNPPSKTDVEKGENSYHGVHLFTYAELEEATNNFDESRELGDGGFGTVYYGKLRDGRVVAVKRLYENNYKRVEQFKNEIEILAGLRHEHLVSLYGCTSRHSRELLLVYDYISNGTVADHLHGERTKPGALPWGIRMKIAIETAAALAYLHASDIIHRDVKTNNILLDNNFCVKVADFGLSRLFPTDVTHVSTAPQGTPGYVDPEYHECYQLTSKSDVYSFGVVLVELISSMPAVDITRHRHEINLSNMAITKIQSDALHELVDSSLGFETDYMVRRMISGVAELAFQCLQCAKDMRPTMDRVLEVLKEIQNHNYSIPKAEEMDIPSDDVGLLKSGSLSLSPDSDTAKWNISSSTTPNVSG